MVIVGGCGVFVRERKWEQLKTARSVWYFYERRCVVMEQLGCYERVKVKSQNKWHPESFSSHHGPALVLLRPPIIFRKGSIKAQPLLLFNFTTGT